MKYLVAKLFGRAIVMKAAEDCRTPNASRINLMLCTSLLREAFGVRQSSAAFIKSFVTTSLCPLELQGAG